MQIGKGAYTACRPGGYEGSDDEFDEDDDEEFLFSYAPAAAPGLPRLIATSGFSELPSEVLHKIRWFYSMKHAYHIYAVLSIF